MKTLLKILVVLLMIVIMGVGIYWPTPFLKALRSQTGVLYFFEVILLFLMVRMALQIFRYQRHLVYFGILLFVSSLSFLIFVSHHYRYEATKRQVLAVERRVRDDYTRHLIMGFDQWEEADFYVKELHVGGIYLSQRNIRGLAFSEVKKRIETWQKYRLVQNLPKLWVAADHEGGIVAKLNPLVTTLPVLSSYIMSAGTLNSAKLMLDTKKMTAELADLGINMNFGIIADLKNNYPKAFIDTHSLIDRRAVSTDPKIVAEVATILTKAHDDESVVAVIKHFPGLGHVNADTHFQLGKINLSFMDWMQKDAIPFYEAIHSGTRAIMIGHVLSPLDPKNPASLSKKVISFLRQQWGFEGILVTDDFAMGPISGRKGGVAKSCREAHRAGVDFILLSYDDDQIYPCLVGMMSGGI